MLHLNQTFEVLTGGLYNGNILWRKGHNDMDNCFKIYQITEGEVYISDQETVHKLTKQNLYFINGDKLTDYYCKQAFSTQWFHFLPKDLFLYQELLNMPTVVNIFRSHLFFQTQYTRGGQHKTSSRILCKSVC